MEGHPVILRPEGTILPMIALGGAGGIHQDSNAPEQVITPLKHNVQGCTQEVIGMVESTEEFSNLCINRENLIYQTLPKDPNISNCIAITERGIHFPYLGQGNVRQYLQKHSNSWTMDHIITIHTYGIIHSDISARNFFVDDDLSIKLCNFAGSRINDLESLVGEESAYHSFFATDFQDRHICSWVFDLWNLDWYTPISRHWRWWTREEIHCPAFPESTGCLLSGYHLQMLEIAIPLCWSAEARYSLLLTYILWPGNISSCFLGFYFGYVRHLLCCCVRIWKAEDTLNTTCYRESLVIDNSNGQASDGDWPWG